MLKLFAVILFTCKTMYNKTIIRFDFCDIRNNQGLGKCYQSKPVTSALIIPDIAKTSSNNSLLTAT